MKRVTDLYFIQAKTTESGINSTCLRLCRPSSNLTGMTHRYAAHAKWAEGYEDFIRQTIHTFPQQYCLLSNETCQLWINKQNEFKQKPPEYGYTLRDQILQCRVGIQTQYVHLYYFKCNVLKRNQIKFCLQV